MASELVDTCGGVGTEALVVAHPVNSPTAQIESMPKVAKRFVN